MSLSRMTWRDRRALSLLASRIPRRADDMRDLQHPAEAVRDAAERIGARGLRRGLGYLGRRVLSRPSGAGGSGSQGMEVDQSAYMAVPDGR